MTEPVRGSVSLAVLLPAEEAIDGGGSVARWADNVYSQPGMAGFHSTLFGTYGGRGGPGRTPAVALLRTPAARGLHRRLGRLSPRLDGWLYCAAAVRHLRRFDRVHVHKRPHNVQLLRRLGLRRPIVLHLHRDESRTSPAYRRRLANSVSRLVFCSRAQRDQWVGSAEGLRERTVIVHNGADPARFTPTIAAKASDVILYVGRFDPGKGVDLLLDAYAVLRRELPDIRLRIVAREDGSAAFASAKARIELLKQAGAPIEFLGEISHEEGLPGIIATATVLCVPSVCEEAFPLTVVEGMLAGTAVVATRSGGIPEALGESGALAEKSASGLATSLAAVLTDSERRRSFEVAGRRRALELFTWQRVAENTCRVLQESLEAGQPMDR